MAQVNRSLTGPYSQRQLARDSGLSKHRVGTLLRLGAASADALTWRDAIALRALVECGLTVDPATRLSARDRALLDACRDALADRTESVDPEMRLLVMGADARIVTGDRELRRSMDDALDAGNVTVHVIPVGNWAEVLLAELKATESTAVASPNSRSAA